MRASTGQYLGIVQAVREPVSRRYASEQSIALIGQSRLVNQPSRKPRHPPRGLVARVAGRECVESSDLIAWLGPQNVTCEQRNNYQETTFVNI
jgi:hypothetical protein